MQNSIEQSLKIRLGKKRYDHSLGVAKTAVDLANKNGVSTEKAYLAGIVHDYARDMSGQELVSWAAKLGIVDELILRQTELLHAPIGAHLIKVELGINDPEIISAVASHTLGRRKMDRLEQIIYLADMIEPNRSFQGVELLRLTAAENLEQGVVAALNHTITFLLERGKLIHGNTIEARNYLLLGGNTA